LRAYASKEAYQPLLSTEATPDPGKERKFTVDDLKLFAFIAARTRLGESHSDVAERIAADELVTFDWTPTAPPRPTEGAESQQAALVPLEQLRAMQALLADSRQREVETKQQAQAQIEGLQAEIRQEREKIEQLQRELGEAKGELTAMKRR